MGQEGLSAAGKSLKTAKAKSQSGKNIKINPDAKIKEIEAEDSKGAYRCSCCGKVYPSQKSYFSVSNSVLFKGNNGYITVCRSCVDKYFKQLIAFYDDNEEHAIEHICWLFDWYYCPEASAMTRADLRGHSRAVLYPSKMSLAHISKKGKTYLDTLRDKHATQAVVKEIADAVVGVTDENGEQKTAPPKAIELFGYGYTIEEYNYLLKEYEDWTARYPCDTKVQEELYKTLAIAQLAIQRAQKQGDTKSIASAMKAFQDLLGTANIKPTQDKPMFEEDESFGTLIKKLENERPISEPLDEWKDIDGIQKMTDVFFLGHMAELLHINNDCASEYREEMAKYTVEPPQYEEDEEPGDTSILDKYGEKDNGGD